MSSTVVLLPLVLAFVPLSISDPIAAGATGATIVLSPTGADDTANIQAALDECEPGCSVQLEAGTFHIAQVIASDFHGSLRGMGRGITVLQALPTLPVNHATPWPWAALPTPTAPWPVLITFLGGDFVLSDVTVRIPGSPATQPWVNLGSTLQELIAIQVAGDRANALFERVDVVGARGTFFGFNIIFGIAYEGLVLLGDPRVSPPRPITGSFLETDCTVRSASLATLLFNVRNTRATIAHNAVEDVDIAYLLNEASGSEAEITHNSGRHVLDTGIGWRQGFQPGSADPSHLLIAHNRVEISEGGIRGSADGIDLIEQSQTGTAHADVLDNEITLRATTPAGPRPLRGGIFVTGLRETLIRGNRVEGPGPYGISLSGAQTVSVEDNHVRGAVQSGIAVVSGSSRNMILGNHVDQSRSFDLLWDGSGTGNLFVGNHCRTSDPAGLCARP
jgi:hypothetical protein